MTPLTLVQDSILSYPTPCRKVVRGQTKLAEVLPRLNLRCDSGGIPFTWRRGASRRSQRPPGLGRCKARLQSADWQILASAQSHLPIRLLYNDLATWDVPVLRYTVELPLHSSKVLPSATRRWTMARTSPYITSCRVCLTRRKRRPQRPSWTSCDERSKTCWMGATRGGLGRGLSLRQTARRYGRTTGGPKRAGTPWRHSVAERSAGILPLHMHLMNAGYGRQMYCRLPRDRPPKLQPIAHISQAWQARMTAVPHGPVHVSPGSSESTCEGLYKS